MPQSSSLRPTITKPSNGEAIGSVGSTVASVNSRNFRKKKKTKTTENNDESKRKTLVMVLWVSLVFGSSRLIFAIANLSLLLVPYSLFNWWAGWINIFFGAGVYFSYFFVYMKTNKHFNKKFKQIFLRINVEN